MRKATEREPLFMPEELRYLVWKPKETWRPPRQLTDEQRRAAELELIQYRKREREAWEEEKRRLGLEELALSVAKRSGGPFGSAQDRGMG